ncbi:MAG: anti-sigma factor antagonist [Gammaproteobacteria bacterium]|nr:MAG: anti-sigma factor antagonist [Gammaproteobacteria bacterium]
MSILLSEQDGVLIVMPQGRLDTNNSPEAEQLIVDKIEQDSTRIVYDFSKTDYISSAGLRVVLKSAKMVKGNGSVAICNANEQIHEVFEISGFLTILNYLPNLEDAIKSVS